MGRRRRRVIRVMKRTLPKVFACPRCGVTAVRVMMRGGTSAAIACGSCGLSYQHALTRPKDAIDIYNEFVDHFMAHRVEV